MGTIILYSSLTGNTKSVAEAMASVMPEGTPCVPVKEAPANLGDYDTVFVGFWVDRGTANKEAAKLIETLTNKHIVFLLHWACMPILIMLVKVLKRHLPYCLIKKLS